MIVTYKDLFGQDQQIEVTGVLENIIQQYQYELSKLEKENRNLKDIIGKIVYLYKEEPTELEEYVKSGFKGGMSN